jgi:hypothetical protein
MQLVPLYFPQHLYQVQINNPCFAIFIFSCGLLVLKHRSKDENYFSSMMSAAEFPGKLRVFRTPLFIFLICINTSL